MNDSVLEAQKQYYRDRAGEYDEWFLRLGRYDRGAAANQSWFDDVAIVRAALDTFRPHGAILEIAGGTGIWTEHLAAFSDDLTVLDASSEVLAINRERLIGKPVRYIETDIFAFEPDRQYDTVFFSFWLSHVPERHFEPFWNTVSRSLAPGGKVFLIDSLRPFADTAPTNLDVEDRQLNDGRTYQIVKRYYRPELLAAILATMGWRSDLRATPAHFLYGEASLAVAS